MQLEHYFTAAGFAALKPDWNRLLRASATDTVFSTWEWQTVWQRHLGAGDLWLMRARAADGAPCAIFPCWLQTTSAGERVVRLVGCADVADYLDVIVVEGREDEALAAFLAALRSADAPAWDRVELCNLRQDSPTLRLLPGLARAAGFAARAVQTDVCPVLPLPASFEEYLASLDKKQRHEIRRKQRRAETEAHLEWYVVDQRHDLEQEMEIFLGLHRQSSRDKRSFMDPRMAAFFRDLARAMAAAGWLQILQLRLDGRPAAALFSFDYGNVIALYNSGFEPAGPHAFLSPGNVLIALAIQYAIGLGRKAFDFLRGDEEYKYRFGAGDTAIYQLELRRGG